MRLGIRLASGVWLGLYGPHRRRCRCRVHRHRLLHAIVYLITLAVYLTIVLPFLIGRYLWRIRHA